MDPFYKANRTKVPDSLSWQLRKAQELSNAMGLSPLAVPTFEADDIIGTLAHRYQDTPNLDIIILSIDKDFVQLLRDNVMLLRPSSVTKSSRDNIPLEVTDAERAQDLFGVRPDQLVDFLALVGDPSDNVAGVSGIGKVWAARLLQKYGSIKEMLNNPELEYLYEVPEGTKLPAEAKHIKIIFEARKDVELGQRLITLDTNMNDLPSLEELRFTGFDAKEQTPLHQLMDQLNMKATWTRIKSLSDPAAVAAKAASHAEAREKQAAETRVEQAAAKADESEPHDIITS
jgi:DNA polymerase I